MNCTIVVEQKDGDKITTAIYTLDDYRVATAIQNIMDNVSNVEKEWTVRKGRKDAVIPQNKTSDRFNPFK